jgi:hypothetical protein
MILSPLPVLKAGEDHRADTRRLAGGRDAEQLAGLRSCGHKTPCHFVALCDHILDLEVEVRHACAEVANEGCQSLEVLGEGLSLKKDGVV